MTMTNTVETGFLNDTDLDLVVGGVRDNPWSDAANQRLAASIGTDTFGSAISGNLLPDAGSHGGAIPFPMP